MDLKIEAKELLSIVLMYGILPIKNLTLSVCSLDDLYQLFRCAPNLQYLKIEKIKKNPTCLQNKTYLTDGHTVHLKQLIMYNFNDNFDRIIMLLKQTPNLRSLTISGINTDMIDAWRWEYLITSLLPQLAVFRFKFSGYYTDDILRIFEQFQSDFWLQQHHWYSEYTLESDSAMIYTIPYISDTYQMTPDTKRSYNKLINNINIFDNVSYLKLHQEVISLQNSYYFPNVISLKLKSKLCFADIADRFLKMEHIHSLKTNVYLSNVKHLAISSNCEMESSSVLLHLLKQTPQLSSLDMELDILQSFFDNDELCTYFNKLITRLDIHKYSYNGFNNSNEIEKFCRIFSNIEHLTCYINQLNDLVYLLIHLRNLFMMEIHISTVVNRESFVRELNNEAQKLKRTINIELENADRETLYISID
jgi:hypothetical protein